MRFVVINLERRPDRLTNFRHYNGCLSSTTFRVSSAVDGQRIDEEAVADAELLAAGAEYPIGHLATALSHRNVLVECAAGDEPFFVCEDDAVIRADFVEQWSRFQAQMHPDWDFCLLGYNFDSGLMLELLPDVNSVYCTFDTHPLTDTDLEVFQATEQPVTISRLGNAFGLPAYAVTPKGAKLILEHCFPLDNRTIYYPALGREFASISIDCLLNDFYRRWMSYAVFPPLVVTPNDKSQSDTAPTEGHSQVLDRTRDEKAPPSR